jgi:hypothetical protein
MLTELFILLLISCMIQVACLLPQAIKIGRETSKNNGFKALGCDNETIELLKFEYAQRDVSQRLLNYYKIKMQFLGMSMRNFYQILEKHHINIYEFFAKRLILQQVPFLDSILKKIHNYTLKICQQIPHNSK